MLTHLTLHALTPHTMKSEIPIHFHHLGRFQQQPEDDIALAETEAAAPSEAEAAADAEAAEEQRMKQEAEAEAAAERFQQVSEGVPLVAYCLD